MLYNAKKGLDTNAVKFDNWIYKTLFQSRNRFSFQVQVQALPGRHRRVQSRNRDAFHFKSGSSEQIQEALDTVSIS